MFRVSMVGLVGLAGCGGSLSCTEIGCSDGLAIHLTAEDFVDGVYVVQVIQPTSSELCTFTVGTCDGGLDCIVDEDCGGLYDLGAGSDEITLMYPVLEGTLTIQIDADGTRVHDQSYDVQYVDTQPNGPDCPPTCRTAAIDITL